MARTTKKFYAVKNANDSCGGGGMSGRIFNTWSEAEKHIKGISGIKHKSFKSLDLATNYLKSSEKEDFKEKILKRNTRKYSTSTSTSNDNNTTSVDDGIMLWNMNLKLNNPIQAYTDGACSKNGQNGAIGAWAVHWPKCEFDDISCRLLSSESQTNNHGELMAIYKAIIQSMDHRGDLEIFTDSTYAINTLTKWMHGWSDVESHPNGHLLLMILKISKKRKENYNYTVYLRKVAAHSGDPGNDMADYLAVNACKFGDFETRITVAGK